MVIKASSAREIAALVSALSSESPVERETAVARLAVIGTRAIERLAILSRNADAPSTARVAALQALDAIGGDPILEPILYAIDVANSEISLAGISTARELLRSTRGAEAVDRLTRLALDPMRTTALRVAAVRVLADLETSTLQPLWNALADSPDLVLRSEVESLASRKGPSTPVVPRSVTDEELPDDPATVRAAVVREGRTLPFPLMHRLLERVREREASSAPSDRPEWTTVRGGLHLALASRGSRLALYDLRESLERSTLPLPVEFLAALTLIGDASSLEAIASAYARSTDAWWRTHLAETFDAIAARERLTRRHAVMKKIEKRWPDIVSGRR